MPRFASDQDIERIARGLLDRSLPKTEWTHAAHFAAALWLLRERGAQALRDMPDLIRRYNVATGGANTDTDGYHETITLASLRAAQAWSAQRAGATLHETVETLLASPFGKSDWPLDFWSKPLLFSVAARHGWVEPDLRPLPF